VQARAWARADAAAAKASIELGGKLHSDAEKTRRGAVRAYLLALRALGLHGLHGDPAALQKTLIDETLESL